MDNQVNSKGGHLSAISNSDCGKETLTSRIVQHNRKRICIRLEQIYWDVFEQIAVEKNCRLNELIHAYYSEPGEHSNKTARLRYIAIDWLSKKNSFYHQQMSLSHDEISAVLRSTTQPAIIFTEDQSVTTCNVKFYEWLAKNIGVKQEEIHLSKLRVSFRRSFRVLLEKFEKQGNSVAREQVSILLPGYAMSVFVNLTLLDKIHDNQKTFMGFF